ncbi:MAG: hypothetical protein Q8O03_05645 [Nanoarchaeota archaeon]|nr:hypothetical protein [Nanoarchaeota archaeon]
MKIPKIFIPEKDLEKKVDELTKKPTKLHPKDLTGPEFYISVKSKEITQRLGKKNTDLCGYVFNDKETALKIEYYPSIQVCDLQMISVGYKGEKVFESAKRGELEEEILTYTPGAWERELEKIYITLQL